MTGYKSQSNMLRIELQEGGWLRCILDRPEALNALHPDQLSELTLAVNHGATDPAVNIVTVEGAGGRAFSAGFDIKVLAELSPQDALFNPSLTRATSALRACPKPTLAIIVGHCLGAGLDLALSCDFRIATSGSRFGIPAVKLGTVYSARQIEYILATLGSVLTKRLFVLGHEFDTESAYAVGLIQEVLSGDDLDEVVTRWVSLPDRGALARNAHKRIIDSLATPPTRPSEFWEPFDALRLTSLQASDRAPTVRALLRLRSP